MAIKIIMEIERPAIHKKWIKDGKMTEEESDRSVEDWKISEKLQINFKQDDMEKSSEIDLS